MQPFKRMTKLCGFLVVVYAHIIVNNLTKANPNDEERVPYIGPAGDLGTDLWEDNNYIKDIKRVVKTLNMTDCWICMHMPGRSGEGIILHGIPWGWDQWTHSNQPKFTHTWSKYDGSVRIQIHLREKAILCFDSSEGNDSMGDYDLSASCVYRRSWGAKNKTTTSTTISLDIFKSQDTNPAWNITLASADIQIIWEKAHAEPTKHWELPDGVWWMCGQWAYRKVPENWTGCCTLGSVIPVIYKLDELPKTRIRNKRAEIKAPLTPGGYWWVQTARAMLTPLGVAMNYRDLHLLNNWTVAMFNETLTTIKLINQELSEVRQVALQNRYALDIILAAKGGVCALIHSHCCMYIHNNSPNITKTVQVMENMIAHNPLSGDGSGTLDIWGAIWSWLPDGSWIRKVVSAIIVIIVMLVMLCCCIQCVPSLFSNFSRMWKKPTVAIAFRSPEEEKWTSFKQTKREEMWE